MEPYTIRNLVETAFSLAKSVGDLFKKGSEREEMNRKEFVMAQQEVMNAVTKTRAYIRDFKEGRRDKRTERSLYRAWTKAGSAIYRFDQSLAADFYFKAEYWADPMNPQVSDEVRQLDAILRDIAALVDPKRRTPPDENEFTILKPNDVNWNDRLKGKQANTPFESKKKTALKDPLRKIELPTVVILTAIDEEYRAVREHLTQIVGANRNDTGYEAGIFELNGKEIAKVIIRECGAKNTTSAQETERAIQYFEPDAVFFVGIAGSRKPQDFGIGDVIFPVKVYSYEGGKSEEKSFFARPDLAPITYTLTEIAKVERREENWKALIKGNYGREVKADLGVIASGEQVIEHYDSHIGRVLRDHYNDTSAVEMESFGFANAASRQGRKFSHILIGVVRGISDILEQTSKEKKSEITDRRPINAKKIASDTAAAFTFWLIFKAFNESPLIEKKISSGTIPELGIQTSNSIVEELVSNKRRRLEQKLNRLRSEWDLLDKKIGRMREALTIETSIQIKFQLEQQLLNDEAAISKLELDIENIENILKK
jgi:nucleoside phosphorylase